MSVGPDTPLTEIAAHLPTEAARLLQKCNPDLQRSVLGALRTSLIWLEQEDPNLDPVEYEEVLMILFARAYALYCLVELLGDLPDPHLDERSS